MRKSALLCMLAMAACSDEANHLGNPLMWPGQGIGTAIENGVYNERRGRVEVFVKTNHPALIADIRAGGGATLEQAFDIARVPRSIRPAHTLQLQSDLALYETNIDALIVAIMVVST
ncbi:hypothetical protein [Octadecabacter sp. R77987]|uniref:hypothetical protein n=1 Tax=Octadecabacter sp. R77987 TaxID=3093874 RepID=UPI00367088A6